MKSRVGSYRVRHGFACGTAAKCTAGLGGKTNIACREAQGEESSHSMPRKTSSTSDQIRRIGVVSDTHGHTVYARQAVRMLESLDVQLVLHCGDIGSADIVEMFAPGRRISFSATPTATGRN